MSHHAIRFADMTPHDVYKVMIGTIVPRPIAWVTTVSPDGVVNAAPYSFFNCLSADPPIVALGVENKSDRSLKDTAYNIRMTEAFTVNIVDQANVEAMARIGYLYLREGRWNGTQLIPSWFVDAARTVPATRLPRSIDTIVSDGPWVPVLGQLASAHALRARC